MNRSDNWKDYANKQDLSYLKRDLLAEIKLSEIKVRNEINEKLNNIIFALMISASILVLLFL